MAALVYSRYMIIFFLVFEFIPQNCIFLDAGKGDIWAAQTVAVSFVTIDPDTGEFDGEYCFVGPFGNFVKLGAAFMIRIESLQLSRI